MSDVKWIKTDSTFRKVNGEIESVPIIPAGIYEPNLTRSGWFLEKIADEFTFSYKLYDLQGEFLNHIKKTYENTTGSIGILFNGTRGTGKSVTAKVFANMLKLPVIIVKPITDVSNEDLISYLASFNFDCVFFFDEFEKQFNSDDCSVLQFMDGIYTSEYRRVFLLTTNSLDINENLLSRPSRIRYIREFKNLEEVVVREYLADNLNDKDAVEELVGYIDTLTISTIDILKTIVEEVNIHGIDKFLDIKKFFNVKTATFDYSTICGTINCEDIAKDGDYTIEDFLRERDFYAKRYELMSERDSAAKLIKSDKERESYIKNWNKEHAKRATFDYDYVSTEKAWDKHIAKKDYWRNEQVIKVDKERRVIVTISGGALSFYYIKQEEIPSLYSKAAYGYNL